MSVNAGVDDKKVTALGCLTLYLLLFGLLMIQAWVVQFYWGWFITPFFSAPPLPVAEALGIRLFMLVLAPKATIVNSGESATVNERVSGAFLDAIWLLGLGFAVHQFLIRHA